MPMMMATIVPVDMARNVLVVILDSRIMFHARAIAGLAAARLQGGRDEHESTNVGHMWAVTPEG